MESQSFRGTGRGWSFPNGFVLDPFAHWHDAHIQQISWVSLFIRGHQYYCQIYSFIHWFPKCPSIVCAWSNIWVIISWLQGIHTTSLKCWLDRQINPSFTTKSECLMGLSRISMNKLSSLYLDWICLINSSFPHWDLSGTNSGVGQGHLLLSSIINGCVRMIVMLSNILII